MDPKFIEELRQKYIKNPPEGMTAKLVYYFAILPSTWPAAEFVCLKQTLEKCVSLSADKSTLYTQFYLIPHSYHAHTLLRLSRLLR